MMYNEEQDKKAREFLTKILATKGQDNKNEGLQEEVEARQSDAYYQALQDVHRGGADPEFAFHSRGFVKNERGNWVKG